MPFKALYDGLSPGVKGYRLHEGFSVEKVANRDLADVLIRLEPAPPRP